MSKDLVLPTGRELLADLENDLGSVPFGKPAQQVRATDLAPAINLNPENQQDARIAFEAKKREGYQPRLDEYLSFGSIKEGEITLNDDGEIGYADEIGGIDFSNIDGNFNNQW